MEGADLKFATPPLPAAVLGVSNTVTSCRVLFGGGTDLKMLLNTTTYSTRARVL